LRPLSRELYAEHVEKLMIRSVSSSRGSARLSGDILAGEVIGRDVRKSGRKTIIQYQIRTSQERLPIRRGDKLTLIDDMAFVFSVVDIVLGSSGDTTVKLDLTVGKTKAGQPNVGNYVELAEPPSSMERIARTMGLAHDRLRTMPALRFISGPLGVTRDYLSGIRALRRNG
jgi:hypothetical protein